MTRLEAIELADQMAKKRRGYRLYYVISVSSVNYAVWDQDKVELELRSRYIDQKHIQYVTDGSTPHHPI